MLCSLSAFADNVVPGITINKSDDSSIAIELSQLQSIRFSEGTMIVNLKDNSQQTFAIDDIKSLTFNDIETAIRTLTNGNAADCKISIADLSGRTIFSGKASNYATQEKLPAGIYVITANGKSCKVMIK